MGDIIETKISVDVKGIVGKIEYLVDEKLMIEVHKLFAKMCDPYVPKDLGNLSQTLNITPEYVQYTQPYAHYMYTGDVYGPNFPIKDDSGNITGWRSPPGIGTKYPMRDSTGKTRQLEYNLEKHKLASKEWNKAMMTAEGEKFIKQVKDLMVRRAKELYG